MILVVSHADDDHALAVLAEIDRRRHSAALVDLGLFPSRGALTQRFGPDGPAYELALDGNAIDLGRCHAAWWRRPRPFTLHDGIAPPVASFAYTECHEAIAGLWPALDATWVNRPELDEVAHHKPYQLAMASEVGLSIPRTLITNDPAEARRFVDQLGLDRVVYKNFVATEDHWRETRVLRADELESFPQVSLAPVIFQELVTADCDLRVTVVGDRQFATSITVPAGGYQVDYRMELAHATMKPARLPDEISARIVELMRRLGLIYGAIDLRRTPDGEHVFLEINPAGEWLFAQQGADQPITTAMAELLIRLDTRGPG